MLNPYNKPTHVKKWSDKLPAHSDPVPLPVPDDEFAQVDTPEYVPDPPYLSPESLRKLKNPDTVKSRGDYVPR